MVGRQVIDRDSTLVWDTLRKIFHGLDGLIKLIVGLGQRERPSEETPAHILLQLLLIGESDETSILISQGSS